MLETTELGFRYPGGSEFAFSPMRCTAGETLLVSGASGVGKTTLLHLLGGLLSPTSGDIYLNQTNLTTLNERQRDAFRGANIGMVFQKMHFIASLNVIDNLLLASWLGRGKKDLMKAEKLLDMLGLLEKKYSTISALSQGQLQRIAIARALMNQPLLLLADEPTSSLDNVHADIVIQLLLECAKEYHAALLVVTHDSRIAPFFDQKIMLK
jgi:putative ABC transport system ATP-binding protein